jgi:hypothetical protein
MKQELLKRFQPETNRHYSIDILNEICDNINSRPYYILLNPTNVNYIEIDLDKVAGTITNAVIENDILYVDVNYLNTPMGKVASELGLQEIYANGIGYADGGIVSKYKFSCAGFKTILKQN